MSDLISRKWLMECVDEGWIKFDTEKDTNKFIHLVRDTAPSAQPEIIRCKDCKCWRELPNGCQGFCDMHSAYPTLTDFCSWAERREVNE